MKKLLSLISILLSLNLSAQEIEERKFDDVDSVYTIKTTTKTIGSRLIAQSNDVRQLSACAILHKSIATKPINLAPFEATIYFFFRPDAITIITGGVSSIRIKFTDGEVVEYKHEGSNKLFGSNEAAVIYFTALETDKILKVPIQSVKVLVSSGEMEYDVDAKRNEILKRSLQLLVTESKNTQ